MFGLHISVSDMEDQHRHLHRSEGVVRVQHIGGRGDMYDLPALLPDKPAIRGCLPELPWGIDSHHWVGALGDGQLLPQHEGQHTDINQGQDIHARYRRVGIAGGMHWCVHVRVVLWGVSASEAVQDEEEDHCVV